jgi:hypothetical protein
VLLAVVGSVVSYRPSVTASVVLRTPPAANFRVASASACAPQFVLRCATLLQALDYVVVPTPFNLLQQISASFLAAATREIFALERVRIR